MLFFPPIIIAMRLYEELFSRIVEDGRSNVVSITGGGGKTSLLVGFSSFLSSRGLSVLVTTTTKIQNPTYYRYGVDHVFSSEIEALRHNPIKGESVFYAERSFDTKKYVSPRLEVLELLSRRYDVTLVEADGSRGLPLKYHTSRDPVILPSSTAFIAVMGLDGVGRKAYEVVFGSDSEDIVDERYIEEYFNSEEGLLKGSGNIEKRLVLFNKADAYPFDSRLAGFPHDVDILVCSEEKDELFQIV